MTARDFIPKGAGLAQLADAAQSCRGCDLWKNATRAVFGEGPGRAEIMLVGEQPGDQEDRRGRPFVGPAGKLLDEALKIAGIDRSRVYVTNVVKHFKWVAHGKRRIHQKPNAAEMTACRPWLDEELERISPRLLVLLGATAAQALLGRGFKVTESRGVPVESDLAPLVMATVHPSSVLRAPDGQSRELEMKLFVKDLSSGILMLDGASGK